ncbi:MAG: uncharacterized protein JWQ37_1352 [Blastococcus sp.]|nr:uncharacterized protein [Blastococcus sp.]
MENRAAVFTSQPQAIEVYQAGTWWAGELLGWRHDADGSCQVWVRVVLGGVEETAWTDLATLRLPERHLSIAQPLASVRGTATQEMSVARHPSGRRARSADADAQTTAGLPLVRDLSVVPDLPSAGGRRTADETAQFASVGRRRAPETGESPSVGRRRAPEEAVVVPSEPAPSPGRHRAPAAPAAPADPGRHRTADTGLFPAVSQGPRPARPQKGAAQPQKGAAQPQKSAAPSRDGWTAPEGMEADLLTRPMRLSDHVPHSRRPRLDGSLSV